MIANDQYREKEAAWQMVTGGIQEYLQYDPLYNGLDDVGQLAMKNAFRPQMKQYS